MVRRDLESRWLRSQTEPQARGLVQGLSVSGGQLEDGAACGGESGVSRWGVVPASRLHRDQLGDTQPERGALLQQAGDSRTVDQRRQASRKDDSPFLSSVPLEPSAAGTEPAGLQPGESVAAAGIAQANRELVADQLAAAAGEDGRTAGEACPLLLAIVGGRTSDAAAVRGDAGADRQAVASDGITKAVEPAPKCLSSLPTSSLRSFPVRVVDAAYLDSTAPSRVTRAATPFWSGRGRPT